MAYKAFKEEGIRYYKYGNTINGALIGNPSLSNGIISNFSSGNYATTYIPIPQEGINTFEIYTKFKTGSRNNTYMMIIGSDVISNSYHSGFCIQVSGVTNDVELLFRNNNNFFSYVAINNYSLNTTYWCKWIYDGNNLKSYYSLDGNNYTLNNTTASSTQLTNALSRFFSDTHNVGINAVNESQSAFTGSIDLKKSYIKINEKDIWHGTFIEESSSSDYDFYKNVNKYKSIFLDNKYKLFKEN